MKRLSLLAQLCFVLALFNAWSVLAADTNALIDTWETQIIGPGSDHATCFLTFSNDFTWAGYGIALKSFGPISFSGNWGLNSKGKTTSRFTEYRQGTTIPGELTMLAARYYRLHGRGKTLAGIRLKGKALTEPPDVSGKNWLFEVLTQGKTRFQLYTFTAATNLPGWFELTGTNLGQTNVYTINGALVVTSNRRANGYLFSDFGSGGTTSVWSFAGKFSPSLDGARFHGTKDTGHPLVIYVSKH
ncbi:MAG TPA: hypothetical protein VL171_18165 [Verrucomicrobiae bacterium]|nr:hypothetical protein [Verrucomicrobiae bacterium]